MSRTRIVVVVAFLVGGLALTLVLPGVLTAGKKNQTVYLRATFRDAITDKVKSDGQGPYVNAPFITAIINDAGELHLNIDDNSERRVVFIYDIPVYPYGTCPEQAPDTAGGEPVTMAFFTTHNSTSYELPQVNLLAMTINQTAQVNIWIGFETASWPGTFYSKWNRDYNPNDPTRKGGYVIVKATDENGDNVVDRWTLSTIPGTNDKANLHRVWMAQKNKFGYCNYGNFLMPFELVLDRL